MHVNYKLSHGESIERLRSSSSTSTEPMIASVEPSCPSYTGSTWFSRKRKVEFR